MYILLTKVKKEILQKFPAQTYNKTEVWVAYYTKSVTKVESSLKVNELSVRESF